MDPSGEKKSNIGGARKKAAVSPNEGLSNYVFGKVPPQAVPLEEAELGALMLP